MLRCCAVLMCVASLACAGVGAASETAYIFTEIGVGSPGTNVVANAVNDSGQVTGYWGTLGSCSAYIYSGGTVTQLPTPYAVSLGEGINDSGQVAGWDYPPYPNPFYYRAGTVSVLAPPIMTAGPTPSALMGRWSATAEIPPPPTSTPGRGPLPAGIPI